MSVDLKSPLAEESVARYATLLRALADDIAGLLVCDEAGNIAHWHEFEGGSDPQDLLQALNDEQPRWRETPGWQTLAAGGQTVLVRGLSNSRRDVVSSLLIPLAAAGAVSADDPNLKSFADCIEHEMQLDLELDSMTVELTERYEELNLVYHTEDHVNYFRQGQEALRDLTQNCLDYLDVGLSALLLKRKGVAISCSHSSEPIANARQVCNRLAEDVYEWVRKRGETVVINEPTDSLARTLTTRIPHRVLCCPIVDSGGDVIGVLATVNTYEKPIFTNSDRNLLQIMARKASKIIIANYDALTGLMNRNGYEYFMAAALKQVRSSDTSKCLLHINIDQLHIINDTVGHGAGDEVIRAVAGIIDTIKRDFDSLSRLGGDEFGVLLHGCSVNEAAEFAERVCRTVERATIEYEGEKYRVTVSIGVAMITPLSKSVAQVIGGAELACSVAKEQGQNRVEVYRADNIDVLRREEQVHFVSQIQQALDNDGFVLYSQPIRALSPDSHDHHTEILLRLVEADGGIMAPSKFLPAAERYHMMQSIDRWVVRKTLSILSAFESSALARCTFAINLSGQTLGDKGFLEFVLAEISQSGVPPACLCFEVTETAAVAKMDKAVHFMESIRQIGCLFALDDFGSGTSSFGYLKRLPVDILKIDGSIIRDMAEDETSAAMVVAIHQVGRTMNLRTIAEYVESDAILTRLGEIGVDFVQGYAIGMPVALEDRLRETLHEQAAVAS